MTDFRIYIKNMVCNRCIMIVQQELSRLNIKTEQIAIGEVVLSKNITRVQLVNSILDMNREGKNEIIISNYDDNNIMILSKK